MLSDDGVQVASGFGTAGRLPRSPLHTCLCVSGDFTIIGRAPVSFDALIRAISKCKEVKAKPNIVI